jgi:predicted small lipoprotein YifL
MKKTFAILAVAMMMFATGCGKNTPPAAPPENKPDAAVEQVKEKVDEEKEKVDQAKEDATQAVANVKENAQAMLDNAKDLMAKVKDNTADKTAIALDGIVPGINIEAVNEILGEPIDSDGTNFAYSNGIDVKVKDKIVQEVSTAYNGLNTPGAVAVGMAEDALKAVYGDGMTVSTNDKGEKIYKFVDKDSIRAIEFTTKDGSVTKISANLNK